MSKEQTIDLSSLRVGDNVTMTFRVYARNAAGVAYLQHGEDSDFSLSPSTKYTGIVQCAPRPLAVKDRVAWRIDNRGHGTGVILCIAGNQAWVENEFGHRFTAYLHELTRID